MLRPCGHRFLWRFTQQQSANLNIPLKLRSDIGLQHQLRVVFGPTRRPSFPEHFGDMSVIRLT
jgi:hypothetical protein